MTKFRITLITALFMLLIVAQPTFSQGKQDVSDDLRVPAAYLVDSAGADSFGYTVTDSLTDSACRYQWQSAGGEVQSADLDDSTVTIPLNFTFPFYGEQYTNLTVDTNGIIRFGAGESDWQNRPIPNGTQPHIAPFWDDLQLVSLATTQTATSIVATYEVTHPAKMTMQTVLHVDGHIQINYQAVNGDTTGATVGLQGAEGGIGYLFNGFPRSRQVQAGMALCFNPPSTAFIASATHLDHATIGTTATYHFVVTNKSNTFFESAIGIESAWVAEISRQSIALGVGESAEITLTLHIGTGRNTATLTLDNGASASVTTQSGSGIYGYMGASTTDDLQAIDLTSGTALSPTLDLLPEGNYPYDATLNPDESEVWVTGATGDGVVVIDTSTNTIAERITAFGEYPVDVLFGKDASLAYVANRDTDDIAVIDTSTYAVVDSIPFYAGTTEPGKMALNHCTGDIYIVDWFDDNLSIIDVDTQTVGNTTDLGNSLWDLVFSPDAKTLYVADRNLDQIHVVNPDTLATITSISVGDDPWSLDITPDGSTLYVANEDSSSVTVIDTATNTVGTTIFLPFGADPRDIDINTDGTRAYVTSGSITGDDAVYVISTAFNVIVDTINTTPAQNPNVLAIAPQHAPIDYVASFSADDNGGSLTVNFTDTSTNSPTQWLWDFGDTNTSTMQNPSHTYAASGAYEVTLTVSGPCGNDTIMMTVYPGLPTAVEMSAVSAEPPSILLLTTTLTLILLFIATIHIKTKHPSNG